MHLEAPLKFLWESLLATRRDLFGFTSWTGAWEFLHQIMSLN
jgi:hypothetical protein